MAVGANAEISSLIGLQTQVMDLKGKTVVPGFIDAHVHVLSSDIAHVCAVDCDLRSIGEIQAILRAHAQQMPKGEWVQGFKFDDTKTAENCFLTRITLTPSARNIRFTFRTVAGMFTLSMARRLSGWKSPEIQQIRPVGRINAIRRQVN